MVKSEITDAIRYTASGTGTPGETGSVARSTRDTRTRTSHHQRSRHSRRTREPPCTNAPAVYRCHGSVAQASVALGDRASSPGTSWDAPTPTLHRATSISHCVGRRVGRCASRCVSRRVSRHVGRHVATLGRIRPTNCERASDALRRDQSATPFAPAGGGVRVATYKPTAAVLIRLDLWAVLVRRFWRPTQGQREVRPTRECGAL